MATRVKVQESLRSSPLSIFSCSSAAVSSQSFGPFILFTSFQRSVFPKSSGKWSIPNRIPESLCCQQGVRCQEHYF